MSSSTCTILGLSVLAILLAGYWAQSHLPPPTPKIVGIDLGTTYSCIGVYQAVTGKVFILENEEHKTCIPSVVAFREDEIIVGHKAEAQSDHNPQNTIYDAKRFIGKKFTKEELAKEASRYPFKMVLNNEGFVRFIVGKDNNRTEISPEFIGSRIINALKHTAEKNLSAPVEKGVMSVPAEFDKLQRSHTIKAAQLAGIDVLRVINEPTAAALAYGLHKKEGTRNVLVVDLGGGTLDVSLLNIQGGMFLTQAMAGNNHLGGQDFNHRLLRHLLAEIEKQFNRPLSDPEDIQTLRLQVEHVKLDLTSKLDSIIHTPLASFKNKASVSKPVTFDHKITRPMFEEINADLFKKVLEPIDEILKLTELSTEEVDEIVLVGGSTRVPKIRDLIRGYFNKPLNVAVDPELAVVSGVSVQAGILGGVWPLTVSAIEVPTTVKKIHL